MPRWKRPPKRITNEGHVCPDKVLIRIDWKFFEPGMSVFIPAINVAKLESQMNSAAKSRDYVVKGVERIEGGLLGMRFWRIS